MNKLKDSASDKFKRMASQFGSLHSFADDEKFAFAGVLNDLFKNDEVLKDAIPLDPNGSDIYTVCIDGILLAKLIHLVDPTKIGFFLSFFIP
jgi:hypothetical protein